MNLKMITRISVALFIATLSGCEWDFPLSNPTDAFKEPQLTGPWKLVTSYAYSSETEFTKSTPAKGELSILTIMNAAAAKVEDPDDPTYPENVFILGFVEFHKPLRPGRSPGSKTTQFAWATKIGDVTYLNIGSAKEDTPRGDEKDRGYSVVKYVLDGDRLVMYTLNRVARNRITSFLGDFYSAEVLKKQLTQGKTTDWQPALEFTRMK